MNGDNEEESGGGDDVAVMMDVEQHEEEEAAGAKSSTFHNDTTTTTTTTTFQQHHSYCCTTRIADIWEAFLEQMERIDRLEKRVEDHVSRKRRRIQNILEQQLPSHRRSTVRMFVTHQFNRYSGIWTLVVEGKLLIGNLDHASAALVENEGVMSVREQEEEEEEDDDEDDHQQQQQQMPSNEETSSSEVVTQKATVTTTTSKKRASLSASLTPDRNQYKIGAEEEDVIQPITFTHLFERVEVTFRTIYQPRTAAVPASLPYELSPVKKSRSAKRKVVQPDPVDEVDTVELRASAPTKLEWTKNSTAAAAAAAIPGSPQGADAAAVSPADAHAFWVHYNNHFSERPPPPNMKFHSVVAEIKLFPSQPNVLHQYEHDANAEPLYQIANETFRDRIFGGKYGTKPKNKEEGGNADDTPSAVTASTAAPSVSGIAGTGSADYTIPVDNDIQIPLFLSYNEIIMALFQYIQDNKLHDPADKSLIKCDDVLSELLGMESINFGYIRSMLFDRGLIKAVAGKGAMSSQYNTGHNPSAPVCLTYVMNEKSTSAQVPAGFYEEVDPQAATQQGRRPMGGTATTDVLDDPSHVPTVLSFDMDVAIPALFNQRSRDLLLNIKKREFEYTTCRTKARYSLVSGKGNEDAVKTRIEQSVSGQGFIPENIPVFLALASTAHPHSEARSAAQIDARICDLVGRVEESNRKALAAWEAVDALRRTIGVEDTTLEGGED